MKILLIDDHALFSAGLARMLEPLHPDASILSAGSIEDALGLLGDTPAFDLVLVDLILPGITGMAGIAMLRERLPQTPIVVVSCEDDYDTVMQALDRGAVGFILKSSQPALLVPTLRYILSGGIHLPASVMRRQLGAKPASVGSSEPASAHDLGLSSRQMAVFHCIILGQSNKTIARELNLSPSTVKSHATAVFRALKVDNRTQAVIAAGRLGLRFK